MGENTKASLRVKGSCATLQMQISEKALCEEPFEGKSFSSGLPLFKIEVCIFLSEFLLCPRVKPL